MGELNYAPLIDDMTWSYSRIKSFEDCPYRWYLKYIRRFTGKELFFASYGKFMHSLIERYLKKAETKDQLVDVYLSEFASSVDGCAPNMTVFGNYFSSGLSYLNSLSPPPFNIVGVEQRIDFDVDGIRFVGCIDLIAEKDGDIIIIDNKSKNLKPRSRRKKPTKSDNDLDSYLKQLYIYSRWIEAQYGVRPKSLCFNCFRENVFISEPFEDAAYHDAMLWAKDIISKIRIESDFNPDIDFFKCTYLCEMQDNCEYYDLMKR